MTRLLYATIICFALLGSAVFGSVCLCKNCQHADKAISPAEKPHCCPEKDSENKSQEDSPEKPCECEAAALIAQPSPQNYALLISHELKPLQNSPQLQNLQLLIEKNTLNPHPLKTPKPTTILLLSTTILLI